MTSIAVVIYLVVGSSDLSLMLLSFLRSFLFSNSGKA